MECSGHHRGVLLGIAPTGRPFQYPVAAFFRAADGWLTSAWVVGDLDSLRAQLIVPEHPGGGAANMRR